MEDKINITRAKRILINDGPEILEFFPGDVGFAERFYEIYKEFNTKQADYERRSKDLDAHKNELDANGLPANIEQGLAFLHETCEYMRGRVDYLFGAGTSQKVFGDTLSLEMIGEFFEAIIPFIQIARTDKMAKYTNKKLAGKVMK
jgi:hypothetical protein